MLNKFQTSHRTILKMCNCCKLLQKNNTKILITFLECCQKQQKNRKILKHLQTIFKFKKIMLKNVTNWQAYCKLLLKYNNLFKMSQNKKVTNCKIVTKKQH